MFDLRTLTLNYGCPISGICKHCFWAGKCGPDNLCSVAASFGQLEKFEPTHASVFDNASS
jgi:hypothetical protein